MIRRGLGIRLAASHRRVGECAGERQRRSCGRRRCRQVHHPAGARRHRRAAHDQSADRADRRHRCHRRSCKDEGIFTGRRPAVHSPSLTSPTSARATCSTSAASARTDQRPDAVRRRHLPGRRRRLPGLLPGRALLRHLQRRGAARAAGHVRRPERHRRRGLHHRERSARCTATAARRGPVRQLQRRAPARGGQHPGRATPSPSASPPTASSATASGRTPSPASIRAIWTRRTAGSACCGSPARRGGSR